MEKGNYEISRKQLNALVRPYLPIMTLNISGFNSQIKSHTVGRSKQTNKKTRPSYIPYAYKTLFLRGLQNQMPNFPKFKHSLRVKKKMLLLLMLGNPFGFLHSIRFFPRVCCKALRR